MTRDQQRTDLVDAEIEERYLMAMAFFAAQHNHFDHDLTPRQYDRMVTLTLAGGDVRVARHLEYGRLLFATGRIDR